MGVEEYGKANKRKAYNLNYKFTCVIGRNRVNLG